MSVSIFTPLTLIFTGRAPSVFVLGHILVALLSSV